MLNKIIFKIIKKIVLFLKKINLEKFLFDKLIFYIGLNQILENRKNYNDVKNIQEIELKIFSQNGEDGIIDYLIYKLKLNSFNFVEMGVGDYRESNTRFLFERTSTKKPELSLVLIDMTPSTALNPDAGSNTAFSSGLNVSNCSRIITFNSSFV